MSSSNASGQNLRLVSQLKLAERCTSCLTKGSLEGECPPKPFSIIPHLQSSRTSERGSTFSSCGHNCFLETFPSHSVFRLSGNLQFIRPCMPSCATMYFSAKLGSKMARHGHMSRIVSWKAHVLRSVCRARVFRGQGGLLPQY